MTPADTRQAVIGRWLVDLVAHTVTSGDETLRTNYLRFHMARLRRKLEDNPARPRHLRTEPGMGYRYQP